MIPANDIWTLTLSGSIYASTKINSAIGVHAIMARLVKNNFDTKALAEQISDELKIRTYLVFKKYSFSTEEDFNSAYQLFENSMMLMNSEDAETKDIFPFSQCDNEIIAKELEKLN